MPGTEHARLLDFAEGDAHAVRARFGSSAAQLVSRPSAATRATSRGVLPSPGRATPLVKSRRSARICRKLNRILCFHDAHGLSEIGFVRRVLPISPVPLSSSACFSTPSGQLKGTSARASQAAMPETYRAHTRHSGHASARAKYAEYVPRMRSDDGIARPTRHSWQIATTALGLVAVSTLAFATSAMIGRTG